MTAPATVFRLFIIMSFELKQVQNKSFETKLLTTIMQNLLHTDNATTSADILPIMPLISR